MRTGNFCAQTAKIAMAATDKLVAESVMGISVVEMDALVRVEKRDFSLANDAEQANVTLSKLVFFWAEKPLLEHGVERYPVA